MNKMMLGAIALLSAAASPALAGTVVVNDTIEAGDTYNRPLSGSPPYYLSGIGDNVYYDVTSFSVTANGYYYVLLESSAFDSFVTLYAGSFQPDAPLLNAIAADDNSGGYPSALLYRSLTAGVTYFAVASTYDNGEHGAYDLTLLGPGDINILPPSTGGGGVPEPATWAMLIAGFGMVGGMMRKRRANIVNA